jgi:prolyl 4-hydroxylase
MEQELILKPEERKDAIFQHVNLSYPNLYKGIENPPIYGIKEFLTSTECQKLIDISKDHMVKSIVVNDKSMLSNTRTSSTFYVNKKNEMYTLLSERVSELLNIPIEQQELPQVTLYKYGQFYKEHYDHFNSTTESGRASLKNGGQRIATVLIYLNQPSEGGGTYFKKLGFKVKPRTGSTLLFFPATLDGRYDPLTLHEAEEAKDDKWVCQIWIRQGKIL